MGIEFTAEEVFQIAEQIERNGKAFYNQAANHVSNPPAVQILSRLAKDEEEHEKIFARLRGELTAQDRKTKTVYPESQTLAYLRAWADGQVFDVRVGPAERLTGKEKVEDIYRMAIGIEKDSIIFYLGMKEAVPENYGREKIDRIIKEEMGHMSSLTRELETLRHQII
jgi:rubrerythrin